MKIITNKIQGNLNCDVIGANNKKGISCVLENKSRPKIAVDKNPSNCTESVKWYSQPDVLITSDDKAGGSIIHVIDDFNDPIDDNSSKILDSRMDSHPTFSDVLSPVENIYKSIDDGFESSNKTICSSGSMVNYELLSGSSNINKQSPIHLIKTTTNKRTTDVSCLFDSVETMSSNYISDSSDTNISLSNLIKEETVHDGTTRINTVLTDESLVKSNIMASDQQSNIMLLPVTDDSIKRESVLFSDVSNSMNGTSISDMSSSANGPSIFVVQDYMSENDKTNLQIMNDQCNIDSDGDHAFKIEILDASSVPHLQNENTNLHTIKSDQILTEYNENFLTDMPKSDVYVLQSSEHNDSSTYYYVPKDYANFDSSKLLPSKEVLTSMKNDDILTSTGGSATLELDLENMMAINHDKIQQPIFFLSVPNDESNAQILANQVQNTVLTGDNTHVKQMNNRSLSLNLDKIKLDQKKSEKIIDKICDVSIEERIATRNSLLPRPKPRKKLKFQYYVQCKICNAKFNNESYVCIHPQKQGKNFNWICSYCDKSYRDKGNLQEHEKHCRKAKHTHKCKECQNSFHKETLLDDHTRGFHDQHLPYKCSVCSKTFIHRHDLKMHLNLHLGIKNNVCDVCGRQFGHPSNLIRHYRTHSGVKPYVCATCGIRFLQLTPYYKHCATHKDKVNSSCPWCSQVYENMSELVEHVKINHKKNVTSKQISSMVSKSGKKRAFYCQVCGERFKLKQNLITHEKLNHSGSDFFCKSCEQQFNSIKLLKDHSCVLYKGKLKNSKKTTVDQGLSSAILLACDNDSSTMKIKNNDANYSTNEAKFTNVDDKSDEMLVMYITPGGESMSYIVKKKEEATESETNLTSIASIPHIDAKSTLNETIMIDINEKSNENKIKDSLDIDSTADNGLNNITIDGFDDISNGVLTDNGMAINDDSSLIFSNVMLNKQVELSNPVDKISNDMVTKHNTSKLETTKPSLKCKECGKEFKKRWNLQQHEGIHNASLHRYTCKICGKTFAYRSTLKNHEKGHESVKSSYKCDICDKLFATKIILTQHHKRTHLKIRPYSCDICPKTFFSNCDYNYHMRIHLKINPYVCFHCGKKFSHVSHLIRHERLHTGERQFQCSRCPKAFIQAVTLRSHMKKHEKEDALNTLKPTFDSKPLDSIEDIELPINCNHIVVKVQDTVLSQYLDICEVKEISDVI